MTLGERIRKRRQELHVSQRELARRLHTRYATISDLERGVQKDMSLGLLRRLATALGVTADYLIGMYENAEEEAPVQAVAWGKGRQQGTPNAEGPGHSSRPLSSPPRGT